MARKKVKTMPADQVRRSSRVRVVKPTYTPPKKNKKRNQSNIKRLDDSQKQITVYTGPPEIKCCWVCHLPTLESKKNFQNCKDCHRIYHVKCLKDRQTHKTYLCRACNQSSLDGLPLHKEINSTTSHVYLHSVLAKTRQVEERKKIQFARMRTATSLPCSFIEEANHEILNKRFSSTAAFYHRLQDICHDAVVQYGVNSTEVRKRKAFLTEIKKQLLELEACPTCYKKSTDSSRETCRSCLINHDLVWSKMKGSPPWPAKVLKKGHDKNIIVKYFGTQDWSIVRMNKCTYYHPPAKSLNKSKSPTYRIAMQEIEVYIRLLRQCDIHLKISKENVVYNGKMKQLKEMRAAGDILTELTDEEDHTDAVIEFPDDAEDIQQQSSAWGQRYNIRFRIPECRVKLVRVPVPQSTVHIVEELASSDENVEANCPDEGMVQYPDEDENDINDADHNMFIPTVQIKQEFPSDDAASSMALLRQMRNQTNRLHSAISGFRPIKSLKDFNEEIIVQRRKRNKYIRSGTDPSDEVEQSLIGKDSGTKDNFTNMVECFNKGDLRGLHYFLPLVQQQLYDKYGMDAIQVLLRKLLQFQKVSNIISMGPRPVTISPPYALRSISKASKNSNFVFEPRTSGDQPELEITTQHVHRARKPTKRIEPHSSNLSKDSKTRLKTKACPYSLDPLVTSKWSRIKQNLIETQSHGLSFENINNSPDKSVILALLEQHLTQPTILPNAQTSGNEISNLLEFGGSKRSSAESVKGRSSKQSLARSVKGKANDCQNPSSSVSKPPRKRRYTKSQNSVQDQSFEAIDVTRNTLQGCSPVIGESSLVDDLDSLRSVSASKPRKRRRSTRAQRSTSIIVPVFENSEALREDVSTLDENAQSSNCQSTSTSKHSIQNYGAFENITIESVTSIADQFSDSGVDVWMSSDIAE